MKKRDILPMRFTFLLPFAPLAGAVCVFGQTVAPASSPLASTSSVASTSLITNDSILQLVKAGLGEEVIVGMVATQPGQYTVTPEALIALKQAGVSDKLIAAIVGRAAKGSATTTEMAPAEKVLSSRSSNAYVLGYEQSERKWQLGFRSEPFNKVSEYVEDELSKSLHRIMAKHRSEHATL
jgi:hypothetical protein